MEYRRVGNSGLRVSALSIGGWLTIGKSVEDNTAHDILKSAIDGGINFIDVADIYATGESERVVGEFISQLQRSDIVLSSKVFWPMSENPNDRGLSRKHIMESIDKSLSRLQTDYLDIYYCHRWDDQTPLLETMRAMDDLIRQGKILYWGTSMWSAEQLRQAHELAEKYGLYAPIVEQPRYNLIHREIEPAVKPAALELGMGLTVWSPLAQGILTGKYNDRIPKGSRAETPGFIQDDLTAMNLARTTKMSELAAEAGMEPGQLALGWLLQQDGISSVITGASKVSQVVSNLKTMDYTFDESLISGLEEIFGIR